MNAKSIVSLVVGLCASSPLLAAQQPGTKPETKPASGVHAPQAMEKKPAAEAGQKLSIPVSGLTADKEAKIEGALTALSTQVHVCTKCKAESAQAGTCTACATALEAQKVPVLAAADVAVDQGTVQVTLRPNRMLSLNDLEAALGKESVRVEDAKLKLPGTSTLVLTGLTQDQLPALEKALLDSKLFSSVHASIDAKSKEVRVRVSSVSEAPTRAAVETLVAGTSLHPELRDILVGSAAMPRG